ncbi:D-tagatose-bisphosphate aldolase, class II, non-catalytic subunit [Agrobacterium burrii]
MSTPLDQNLQIALAKLFAPRPVSLPRGITSVCSAHPLVIEAALLRAAKDNQVVLLEATCNQVNQEGGYTGMTPMDFRQFVEKIAVSVEFPIDRIILGGDHLGPNPWRKLSADEAMARAEAMIIAYVEAGFEKLHLDTSMGCAGEPTALTDELTAARAARLANVAEDTANRIGGKSPVYIIGTEVPPPGGATHALDDIELTRPEAALKTLEVHQSAFAAVGAEAAMDRVIGIVVQPGVEFGNENVVLYRPERAGRLTAALGEMPGLLFEAHSTDYQQTEQLSGLVDGGFGILKVGPSLTFALREALYGLDAISRVLTASTETPSLPEITESVMLDTPEHWAGHYGGTSADQKLQRHYSYSDRIRYYWPDKRVTAAIEELFAQLPAIIPETLISQHLARIYPDVVAERVKPSARDLCLAAIDAALAPYSHATAHR